MNIEKLDAAIRAVAPIHGVNSDRVISFKDEATPAQRVAAQAIADGWDFNVVVRDVKAEIAAMEYATLTGRGTREFMLSYFESNFTPEQLAANPGYVKAKALDNQIKALRALL